MNSPMQASSGSRVANMSEAAVLFNRSGQTKEQKNNYNNEVKKRDETPAARQPQHFGTIKAALLATSVACLGVAFATLAFAAKAETQHGYQFPGMRDVPFSITTGAMFLSVFAISVSLSLIGMVYRNWHPVLLSYTMFVLMVFLGNVAILSMLTPGPSLALNRAGSWLSMTPELQRKFYEQYNCCGYSNALVRNRPTCNLSNIGKSAWGAPAPKQTTVAAAPVTPPVTPAQPPSTGALSQAQSVSGLVRRQLEGGGTEEEPTTPGITGQSGNPAGTPVQSTGQAPSTVQTPSVAGTAVAPAPSPTKIVVPLFTNPAPLISDSKPTGPPSVPNLPPPLPDSGVDFCQKFVDPMLDTVGASIKKFFILGAVTSIIQLGLLGIMWNVLGKWKRSRGVARW